MAIAYFQPITRAELSSFFGREVSRDMIGTLRSVGLIASGPRSPRPAPPTPMSPRKASASTPCATLKPSKTLDCWRRKTIGGGYYGQLLPGRWTGSAREQAVVKDEVS